MDALAFVGIAMQARCHVGWVGEPLGRRISREGLALGLGWRLLQDGIGGSALLSRLLI